MAERCDDIVSRCRLRLAEFAVAVLGLDPYDWQINTYEDINDYRRTAVVAANGSGKTVSLVGPVVLWWLYCFPRGRVVLTSGSWRQLKTSSGLQSVLTSLIRHSGVGNGTRWKF